MADITPQSWATDLLTRMGYPVNSNNMTSVLAWEYQEGGHFANAATYNPLNTTLGHATYGSMNGAGVSTYPDYETGMSETIKTLNSHYYDKIRADLAAGADPATTTADIKASPWGTWHGGASTTGALNRARGTVAAHPPTATTPTPTTPTTPTTTATPVHPVVTPTATPAAALAAPAAAPPAAATTGSSTGFLGADVDGLTRLSQEFTQAAQIVNEVKMVCQAIVAAASLFGPFGAAFVAYLKGTVIPWLTTIGQALSAMAQVLNAHAQAQTSASSSATSLPNYTSPTTMPATSTQNFPTLPTVVAAAAAVFGLAVAGPAGAASATAVAALIGSTGTPSTGATGTGATTSTSTPGAVPGATGAPTASEGAAATGEKPEDPERIAPHTAEASKNFGTVMNRDAVTDFEKEELGVDGGSMIHPTATIAQGNFDLSALSSKGEYVDANVLQVKGGGALFGGYDPTSGYQLGAAGQVNANLVDVKLHDDIPLGSDAATLKLSDESTIGASAQGSIIGGYNPSTQTLTANAGGEAFIGARTTATVQEVTPYFTNTTELVGQAGAGAAADGGIVLSPGHIDIHGGVGAAVGLGGKVSDNLDINYGKIGSDVYTGATNLVNGAAADIDAAGTAINSYLSSPGPYGH